MRLLNSASLFTLAALVSVNATSAMAQSAVDRSKILATNAAFYEAFRSGDLKTMRGVWSSEREIGMTPPGRDFLKGEKSIMSAFALMMIRPPKITCEMEGSVQFRDSKAVIICNEKLGGSDSVRMMNVFGAEESEGDEPNWRMIYHGPVPKGWKQI